MLYYLSKREKTELQMGWSVFLVESSGSLVEI